MTRVRLRDSNSEQIPFSVHPRLFSEIGERLITSDYIAISELVKNSYDAGAKRIEVRFGHDNEGNPQIEVSDDGLGMSRDVIKSAWCVVGTPYKLNNPINKKGKSKRRVSGEKGIGRLCTARLGDTLELITSSRPKQCWKATIRWDSFFKATRIDQCAAEIEKTDSPFQNTGTRIVVRDLKVDWDTAKIEKLRVFLSRLVPPFQKGGDYEIHLYPYNYKKGDKTTTKISSPEFISYPPYKIKGAMDEHGEINYTISYPGPEGVIKETKKGSVSDKSKSQQEANSDKKTALCGPFKFEIRVWERNKEDSKELRERFSLSMPKYTEKLGEVSGIRLYRDDILVLPKTESVKDWVGLDARRISRIGTRISTKQIVGCVEISADTNSELVDTADRERLVDNNASKEFIKAILDIVKIIEKKRENVSLPPGYEEPPFHDLIGELAGQKFVDGTAKIVSEGGTASDVLDFVSAQRKEYDNNVKAIKKRLVYYNQLATLGTLSSHILHEIGHRTSIFDSFMDRVEKNLVKTSIATEAFKKSYNLAKNAIRSLYRLAKRLTPLAGRSFATRRKNCILEEMIEECVNSRKADIKKSKIDISDLPDTKTTVAVDPGEVMAIILNLLDNAIYWLRATTENERYLAIEISDQGAEQKRVVVKMHDSGPGVQKEDEGKIFWPGWSARKEGGFGMGLTVAAELVHQYGGKMALMQPGEYGGGSFIFDLPTI